MATTMARDLSGGAGWLEGLVRRLGQAAAVAVQQAAVAGRWAAEAPAAGDGTYDGEDAGKLLPVRHETSVREGREAQAWRFLARLGQPLRLADLTPRLRRGIIM